MKIPVKVSLGVLGVIFFIGGYFLLNLNGCSPKNPAQNQAKEAKKIVIWYWMTDRQNTFEEIAKKYEAEKGVKVEFKLVFPPDIYSQKVIAAARATKLPEIFGILGEKSTLASFITAGHIENLTPYMEAQDSEWKSRFYPQTIGLVIFKEGNSYGTPAGVYGVPIDTTIMQFVYNKSLFKKAGLDPQVFPQTLDEFIEYSQKIKTALGVNGFVSGWSEGWLLNALATEWAINFMGEDKFLKTIKGEVPYTDKDWLAVFSLFAKMRDAGILVENIATMTNKEAEDAFARGKAVFSFNGTWAVNVYKQLNPDLDYAFFALPRASSDYPVKIWGGAGSSFMVNSKSPYKQEAIEFLKWITLKEQQEILVKDTNNLSAIKGCEEVTPPVLKGLTSTLDNLTHPDIWPKNEDSRVLEVMNRGLQQIIMGVKTPQEVLEAMQRVKEKVLKR